MSANNWQAGGSQYSNYQTPAHNGDESAEKPAKSPSLIKRLSSHILHSVDSFLGTNDKQPANQSSFFVMKDEEPESAAEDDGSSDDESLEELEGSFDENSVEMHKEPINGRMNGSQAHQPISNSNSVLSPSTTSPDSLDLNVKRMNSFLALVSVLAGSNLLIITRQIEVKKFAAISILYLLQRIIYAYLLFINIDIRFIILKRRVAISNVYRST